MDLLFRCFGRRKPYKPPSDDLNTNQSIGLGPSPAAQRVESNGGDIKTLTDLRQKCGDTTLSTAEARALLNASGKFNEPLTPREIEELHRILSPPSQVDRKASSSPAEFARPPRTPTNKMMPAAQEESDLFWLPAEIRAQIWRYAIGGHKIYLAVKQGKLVQQANMERPYWRHINGLLNVPLICRKSYLESINLLYSENTFGFGFGSVGSSRDFFKRADTLLVPQCTAAMTSLEVGFHLSGGYSQYYERHPQAWDLSLDVAAPEPLSNWIYVFRALAQMKQLASLVVVVWASGDRRHQFKAREPELMDIPTRMTGLKRFEVWLPWDEDEDEDADEVPSRLTNRRARPYIVRRDHEDRDRFGVSVPNWKG